MAADYGMGRVHFETDCISLQKAVSSSNQDRGPLGVLFREIKFILQTSFIEFKILYCPRACNIPAHVLAASGSNVEPEIDQCRISFGVLQLLIGISCRHTTRV